ncbi:hypothetical protein WJX84_011467, partial [Apatococcus fuscideae]
MKLSLQGATVFRPLPRVDHCCNSLGSTLRRSVQQTCGIPVTSRRSGFGPLRSERRRGLSVAASSSNGAGSSLRIDLTGKKAFIAGVADDQGFGWAIAKALAEAGAEISLGVWVPALNIFESSYRRGKFDASRKLSNGSLMEFTNIYPMDAVYDKAADVPEDEPSKSASGSKLTWSLPDHTAG